MYHSPDFKPPTQSAPETAQIPRESECITAELVESAPASATNVLDLLDAMSAAQMRALGTKDLRKLESLCWHWASLSENELNERRRASREEESE